MSDNLETAYDRDTTQIQRLQARLAIKDATMEPQRVHIRLLQEKNAELQALNAELLAACKAGVAKLEELGYEHNRTGQMMYEAIDRAEVSDEIL